MNVKFVQNPSTIKAISKPIYVFIPEKDLINVVSVQKLLKQRDK